jgi:hypothetical protein
MFKSGQNLEMSIPAEHPKLPKPRRYVGGERPGPKSKKKSFINGSTIKLTDKSLCQQDGPIDTVLQDKPIEGPTFLPDQLKESSEHEKETSEEKGIGVKQNLSSSLTNRTNNLERSSLATLYILSPML